MIGTYKFYQHGELIRAVPNLITTEGAKAILRYLSGGGVSIGSAIGVGLGATAPTVNDRRLTYELERATVTVASPDFATQRIIFKGTLSQNLVGKIYEAGTFSSTLPSGRELVNFSTGETWVNPVWTSGTVRNGSEALKLSVAANGTVANTISNVGLDLSSYSTVDEFLLAYSYVSNTGTIRIRFLDESGTSYYQYTFTPTTGYNIKSFTKNDMTKVGTVDYSAIASIEVAITATAGGTGAIEFDGLRVEDKDFVDPQAVMISHALVPGAPIFKTNLSPMDIEYALDMTLT